MEFDHNNVRQMVEGDRLSNLPDELIHKILSSFDMKFAVQTSVLSSRWEFLWTSMPCLNLSSGQFGNLPKFAKFVTNVLSRRNHQIEVSSVKLYFNGAASQVFVRKIANYIFSHNVQQLTVSSWPKKHYKFPPCLFSSQSLKHFKLSTFSFSPCITPQTPWHFPAVTTLHLNQIRLCDDDTRGSVDLFSKCVNLKNLTLERFVVVDVEVFDIIAPRLSNLMLIHGRISIVINLVAPQLENLTIIESSIKYLNAPSGISSLSYRNDRPMQLCKERFHSLNKVNIYMYLSGPPYKEEDARKTISMLQELHSARYLTLNMDIIECLSSFSDLLLHHPSPFGNLTCLTIDSQMRNDNYKVKMTTEAKNFLLENSPSATFITDLPEEPPTKAMKQKEAREKKKAKQIAEIESRMKELQALVEQGNLVIDRKGNAKTIFESLTAKIRVLSQQKVMHTEPERTQIGQSKEEMQVQGSKVDIGRLVVQLKICLNEMWGLVRGIFSKQALVRSLLEKLPKREREKVEARYSQQLEEAEAQSARLESQMVTPEDISALTELVSSMPSSSSTNSGLEMA